MVTLEPSQMWVCDEPTRSNPGWDGSRHSAERRLALARYSSELNHRVPLT